MRHQEVRRALIHLQHKIKNHEWLLKRNEPCAAAQLELDSSFIDLIALGQKQVQFGRFEDGMLLAQAAIGIAPERPGGYDLYGQVLEAQDLKAEAARFFRAAIAIHPSAERLTTT